jgi:transposase
MNCLHGQQSSRPSPFRAGESGAFPADGLKRDETMRNLEVIWLLCGLRPDFKTIADFRKDNRNAFKAVFREFVLLCRKLDLFGRELVAVDGTRLKAVNQHRSQFHPREAEKADPMGR